MEQRSRNEYARYKKPKRLAMHPNHDVVHDVPRRSTPFRPLSTFQQVVTQFYPKVPWPR
jgi:hypothetical protein